MPHLKITEVVIVHCNIFNKDYGQDSQVLYTFVPNKSFGQLLNIFPKNCIFLKIFNPNKAGSFESSYSWGESIPPALHISRRTYLILI